MTNQSSEQEKQGYIAEMGEPLGTQFAELRLDIASLHLTWLEFVELFGTKTSRIELLNNAAPHFFRMVQDRLWEAVLLHIARLTDRPESFRGKTNLTLQNLPALIDDKKLKEEVKKQCDAAVTAAKFALDWRNRRIAHRDLDLALGGSATPLPSVTLKQVNDALASFEAILNAISKTESRFGMVVRHNKGALNLIYLLDDGLIAQKERQDRIKAGDYPKWNNKDL
jgi:hypothetical protein